MNYFNYSIQDLQDLAKSLQLSAKDTSIFEQSVYELVAKSLRNDRYLEKEVLDLRYCVPNYPLLKKMKTSHFVTGPITSKQVVLVLGLELDFNEVPLYLNSKIKELVELLKWRLKIGK